MVKALITRKLGMTTILGEDGVATAVTLLSAKPNTITQIKSPDSDGYSAVQLGFEDGKKSPKAQTGHYKLSNVTPKVSREIRVTDGQLSELSVGTQLGADAFTLGERVNATGISKGKGFAGTIKRHNFHRGAKTHGGQSYRRPGSIGSMYPQKIFKGKKMAGHMGYSRITTKNLKVAYIDKEKQVIGLAGALPGPNKGLIIIKGSQL